MNADEKLRDILRAEADEVRPGPEAFDLIRDGIARRRRRVAWLRGGAVATATLTLVAVAVVVRGGGDGGGVDVTGTPSPRPPAPAGTVLDTVWPFVTSDQVDAWREDPGPFDFLSDPVRTVEEFAKSYLGVPNPSVVPGRSPAAGGSPDVYDVRRTIEGTTQQATVTTVTLRSTGAQGPWVVASAAAAGISIGLKPGDVVTSPARIRGTYEVVDPAIDVELRAAPDPAGRSDLHGKGRAVTGPGGWEARFTFGLDGGKLGPGSILVTNGSLADSGLGAALAIPVTFDADNPAVPVPETFVGVHEGDVARLDSSTGSVRPPYLTAGETGGVVREARLSGDGRTIVYVRREGDCAAGVWSVPAGGGPPKVLVSPDHGEVLSADQYPAAWQLAYLVARCEEGRDGTELVRRAADGSQQVVELAVPPASAVVLGPKWTVYVGNDGAIHGYPAGAERAEVLQPAPDCGFTAVARAGDGQFVAAEHCGTDGGRVNRIVRVEDGGGALTLGERVLDTGPVPVRWLDYDESGHHLLVWRIDAAASGEVERIEPDGRITRIGGGAQYPTW